MQASGVATSVVMHTLCHSLGIRQKFMAVYHPHTDGVVECFNQTLKAMIRKVVVGHPNRRDMCLDTILPCRKLHKHRLGWRRLNAYMGGDPGVCWMSCVRGGPLSHLKLPDSWESIWRICGRH